MDEKTKEIVACALKPCDTKELVEGVFARLGVSGLEDKVDCITQCMGSPEFSFVQRTPPLSTRYEYMLMMFLDGKWR